MVISIIVAIAKGQRSIMRDAFLLLVGGFSVNKRKAYINFCAPHLLF